MDVMNYTLRDYQNKAVEQAEYHFDKYGKPFYIVMPTGSGKSLLISELCHRSDEPVLILQPSKEILEQNYEKLTSYGIKDIGIYSASMDSRTVEKYTYATIGSIYKVPEKFKHFKKVIMDEAHNFNPKNFTGMYNDFFKTIGVNKVCGLSATPFRLLQKYVKKKNEKTGLMEVFYTSTIQTINRIPPFFFKKMAYQVSIKHLMEQGYLAPIEYKFYNEFDTSNLKINTTGADYDSKSLENFWNNDEKMKKLSTIIHQIDSICKHNLIFCPSIRQAEKLTVYLKSQGLNADYITSEFRPKDRERLINDFKTGKIKHMVNIGVLSVGFDFPALDCVTLARPTLSLALLYQMAGRALRPDPNCPEKVCKIIDITENIKKLGRIESIKMEKEDGFKDIVTSEVGQISGKPLFTFKLKNEEKIQKFIQEPF